MAIYFVDLPLYLSFDLLWPRNWVNVAIGLRLVFFFPPLMVSIFGFFYHYILHIADIRSPIIFRVFSKACI